MLSTMPLNGEKQTMKRKSLWFKALIAAVGLKFCSQTKDVAHSNVSIYASCDVLPLTVFIECLVNKKYSLLGTNGEDLWLSIYSEYLTLLNDPQSLNSLYQIIQYNVLNAKIYKVQLMVKMLSLYYDDTLAELLKNEGYHFDFKVQESLNRVLNLLKQDEIKRDSLKLTIEQQQGESEEKEPLTSKYFDEILISYEQAFKVPCNKSTMMTQEYCIRVNRLKEFVSGNEVKSDY